MILGCRDLPLRKSISPLSDFSDHPFAADIIFNKKKWNLDFINHIFFPIDRYCIESIPLSDSVVEDKLLWHYNSNGIYSVRFGYKLGMTSMVETGSSTPSTTIASWECLWYLKIPSKVKILI
ncbi:hypothetical protein PanWU01x14_155740 [Parasponia andersonii]|uniref:Uncharacterized protein n=1 Tax=Parasponia andersonii TaxID=3476 RepID=A0A2P5CG86_PARAD|nr:hypothetical protein PanWU01x14_155740 [Parasponia andersonii]